MTHIQFEAPEYTSEGDFQNTSYAFMGDPSKGWRIIRNGQPHLELGPGYELVENRWCGVCSTDLARKYLPYPLPQIIGHEVVSIHRDQQVTVEINASHHARGHQAQSCAWCLNGLENHCPQRITLGINQLPGGFAPYMLAPKNALIPIPPGVSIEAAALAEPLAATLQAVEATWPKDGDRVAVLGPRRLGMLMLTALHGFRAAHQKTFTITALSRHDALRKLAVQVGADEAEDPETLRDGSFDVVFDTTGSPEGFEAALRLSRRIVHLKSTHGRGVMGMNHLSDMVVDEIALLPYSEENLAFHWPKQKIKNINVLVSPNLDIVLPEPYRAHRLSLEEALNHSDFEGSVIPRFDIGVASSLAEADRMIRAYQDQSLIRPRGAILLAGSSDASDLFRAVVERDIQIHSSRCGDFRAALKILANHPELTQKLTDAMITHRFDLSHINEAFQIASDSRKSIKVLVEVTADTQHPEARK